MYNTLQLKLPTGTLCHMGIGQWRENVLSGNDCYFMVDRQVRSMWNTLGGFPVILTFDFCHVLVTSRLLVISLIISLHILTDHHIWTIITQTLIRAASWKLTGLIFIDIWLNQYLMTCLTHLLNRLRFIVLLTLRMHLIKNHVRHKPVYSFSSIVLLSIGIVRNWIVFNCQHLDRNLLHWTRQWNIFVHYDSNYIGWVFPFMGQVMYILTCWPWYRHQPSLKLH
jgi:hypothetical protein